MDYIEIRITERLFERILFIGAIMILLIIAIIAVKTNNFECPKTECNQTQQQVVVQTQVNQTNDQTAVVQEKVNISYVDIERMNFAPKSITITKGTVVVFNNQELKTVHKLYEVGGLFISERMNPGDSFNYTFTEVGNFSVWSMMGKEQNTKINIEVIQ